MGGGGPGMGGGGRGMGGGGRGMGGNAGVSAWSVQDPDDVRYSRAEPDLQNLKARALDLAKQMKEVQEMISKLDNVK